jgi:hypothetical protein
MGGSSSKSAIQQTNEFFNRQTNSFMSSTSQNISASGGTRQIANFSDASFLKCRVNVSQGTTTNITASGTLKTENIQDLTARLKNDAQTAIDNAATQNTGFLAPTVANNATAVSNLKTTVTTIIDNTMKSETVQNIFANAQNNQDINAARMVAECDPQYRLPGEYDFNFDQNILQSVTAKGVADALTKALTDTIIENTSATDVTQSSTQENAGISQLVDSVFKGLTGIWGIIAAILCVICCGVLIFMLSPAGQSATTTAASAGANIAKSRYG